MENKKKKSDVMSEEREMESKKSRILIGAIP